MEPSPLTDDDAMASVMVTHAPAVPDHVTFTLYRRYSSRHNARRTAARDGDGFGRLAMPIVSGVAEVVNAVGTRRARLSVGKSAELLTRGGDGAKQAIVTLTETFAQRVER